MTDFDSSTLGADDDRVRLTLAGADVVVAESYEVRTSILTQPAAFSLRLGWGDVVSELAAKYPPNTPFRLSIGNVVQATGATDGFELDGSTGATMMTVRGRDALAPLHDAFVIADESLSDASYVTLVAKALEASGITDYIIFPSNEANRKKITGVGVVQLAPPRDVTQEQVTSDGTPGGVQKTVQAKLGERRYEYVKRFLDRAGFFLWTAADGSFILSEPNGKQAPTYRIVRRRGSDRNAVNVISARYKNETTHRYSECVVYARGGGFKAGRQKTRGAFVDDEMVAMGYKRPLVTRDVNVSSLKQAEFYARRKLAEARRADWQLVYNVSGHTTPSLVQQGARAVWAPDTIVEVVDDEFGLSGKYYIEACVYRGGPQGTTTELTLMRVDDLIFAETES